MKVLPFVVPKSEKKALIFQVDDAQEFYSKLHQHEEFQLSIILEGSGDLFVGDTVSRYRSGDIILLGSNLPHLFLSDKKASNRSHMLTLFFTEHSFGKRFFDLSELANIRKLIESSAVGIRFKSQQAKIREVFMNVAAATEIERIILFFEIMDLASRTKKERLSSFKNQKIYSEDEGSRMDKVMNLAIQEFHRNISLTEAANVANMTPNAFCRFFKQRTRKTFVSFLNDIRLDHAARLLRNKRELPIAEISDQSGFRNLSNFNRKFKEYKGVSPKIYRSKGL